MAESKKKKTLSSLLSGFISKKVKDAPAAQAVAGDADGPQAKRSRQEPPGATGFFPAAPHRPNPPSRNLHVSNLAPNTTDRFHSLPSSLSLVLRPLSFLGWRR